MDRKADVMRRLGVVGVCKEAYNILRLHVRLFLSLAVTLVLPVGLLIFCQGFVVDPLYDKMRRNAEEIRHEVEAGSPTAAQRYSRLGPDQWLEIIYPIVFVLVLVFSLLPTAAIVYTVASIYTAKRLSYAKVLSAVPKVLKRLFVTSFWAHLLIFITNFTLYSIFVYFFVLAVGHLSLRSRWVNTAGILLVALFFVFFFLAVYNYLVWHLASVVSVLEDSYGIAALRKSSLLIKGKRWVAYSVFLIYIVFTALELTTYNNLVYHSKDFDSSDYHQLSILGRFMIGVVLLVVWTAMTLFGMVVQTVVYFVCKSYHEESINQYALSKHLDEYIGAYMPLGESIPVVADIDETPQVCQA